MTGRISSLALAMSVFISLVFTAIIVWNLFTVFSQFKEANETELKKFYTLNQKQLIKNEVDRIINRIDAARLTAFERTENTLRKDIAGIESFLKTAVDSERKATVNSLMKDIVASMSSNNPVHYFVLNENAETLFDSFQTKSGDSHLSDLRQLPSDAALLIEKTFAEGESTGIYSFYKQGDAAKTYERITYAKYIPELKIIIGAGVYTHDIDNKLKEEFIQSLDGERFGYRKYGYFWVLDTDYNVIYNINKDRIGKNNYSITDVNGKYFFREFVDIAFTRGAGYSEYQWNLPGGSAEPSTKISYLKLYPDWNWIIGTGFYYENYYEQVSHQENISSEILNETITRNAAVILILLTVIMSSSMLLYRKIKRIEDTQASHINDLTQYKTVIDSSSIVSITDTDGVITHANDQFCEITGYTADKLIGSKHSLISHPDNPKSIYRELWETISAGRIWRGIIKNMTADGGYFFQKTTIVPFKNKNGEITRFVSLSHDVTEVFENKSKLQKQLNVDFLTGLGSRTYLLNILNSSKHGELALIDIDNFYKINETYGMSAGDELLMSFAKKLSSSKCLANYDLFRLHSDVFAVFSYTSDTEDFSANVEKAVSDITKTAFYITGKEILMRTTAGIASNTRDLLAHADAALQYAKVNNIDVGFYNPERDRLKSVYETDSNIIKMLSEAIDNDRVVPYFQKIKNVRSSTEKYECLMRIIDTDDTVIPPSEFLEISKQTRFYPKLTKIIARKAIDTFKDTDIEFSINVSTEDVLNQDTMDFIYEYALEKLVIRRLILEIVESESITSSSTAIETLYRFKLAGAKIAIDDFGTGYSNFDYLLKIKADYIKIDGSIIKLINKDERAKDIVRSIVSYARKLNMQTVAEFISEPALADAACNLGIDYLQGYHIAKPVKNIQHTETFAKDVSGAQS